MANIKEKRLTGAYELYEDGKDMGMLVVGGLIPDDFHRAAIARGHPGEYLKAFDLAGEARAFQKLSPTQGLGNLALTNRS